MTELPQHVARNREAWDAWAHGYVDDGRRQWRREDPVWGIWGVPESQVGMFLPELAGLDAIELGCGTSYVCSWLARRGTRCVGIDNSERQLATARALQAEFGVEFPLLHGNAETVPLPDASFDLAISEYGASLWCDPYEWIPEAARLLRPGGRLAFLTNSVLLSLCVPENEGTQAGDRLLRSQFGMLRLEWPDDLDRSVEFHLPHGEMIALLRTSGFEVEALRELRAPADATSRFSYVSLEWSRRWPCEEAWIARKRG